MLFGKKKIEPNCTTIFFATDVHGSNKTFRKFINAGKFYGAQVLVLGGDIAGKKVVPIVKISADEFSSVSLDVPVRMKKNELQQFEIDLSTLGFYPYHVEPGEAEIFRDKSTAERIFHELATERVKAWTKLADERLAGTGIKCFISGGNDDPEGLSALFNESSSIVATEDRPVTVDEYHQMISLGYSNPTPWKTPRECSEEELHNRIESLASQVKHMENCIFNLHAPPLESGLDNVQKLDTSRYPPKPIPRETIPAGSKAVRDAVQKYQPLLSLHGHVHESRGSSKIGRTVCINPGSEYTEGLLLGALIRVTQEENSRILSYQAVSG